MSKPVDIPQDVWSQAGYWIKGDRTLMNAAAIQEMIARAILSAVEEEREACAKAAEWYADTNSEYLPEEVVIACGQTASEIASAIRNRKES